MTNAPLYEPSRLSIIRDTEALPLWERELVTAQTEKVAAMIRGSQTESDLVQRAWARVDRRKRRRH